MSTGAEALGAVPTLDAGHAATQLLAERLLATLREGLGMCPHLVEGADRAATWWLNAPARSCLICAHVHLQFVVFNIAEGEVVLCDSCQAADLTHEHGQAYLLPVGPVLVVALLCDRCGARRMRAEYDLEAAGRQAASLIAGKVD